jgi:hypothetical protein
MTNIERKGGYIREAQKIITEAKRLAFRAVIEAAAKRVDEWALAYPTDVFIEPPPGEHAKTIDGCSARTLRDMLPRVAKAIRALPDQEEKS